MSKILRGEQLVLSQSKNNRELPTIGTKDFQPTHSWLEKKQIENALEQRKELLEEERVERQNCVMVAEWDPDKHKAAVTVKNKHWEVFGHHSDNADWLFPEEVLYLMEMNCLECLFGEVPLSIQRGYSVLLRAEYGCSPHEYRVFSHLCRMGYRVVRHSADLTVTAYERKIRLDQHLDQRTAYSLTTPPENQHPRPDLPPKTIVDLPEDAEVVLQSSYLPLNQELRKSDEGDHRTDRQLVATSIEVIDVLDSSDESSSEESSDGDDSDIEIVHVLAPNFTNKKSSSVAVKEESEDSDIEIIEVPVHKKEIIVETIGSSDSEDNEDEDEISGSSSDESYDGNWKRKQPNNQRSERPSSLVNYKFSSVEEFCNENCSRGNKTVDNVQLLRTENTEMENMDVSNEDHDNIDLLIIEPTSSRTRRPNFVVTKSRNEILDLMPTMAGPKRKLIPLDAPDLRLIPESIVPKQQSYTYSMNSLQARVFRPPFRGRFRGVHGSRFGRFNSYHNNSVQNINPFPMNATLPQMCGSDVQSMARGMMQIASALLFNLPNNIQTNSLLPFAQQPQQNYFRSNNYPPSRYNSPRISEVCHNNFHPRNSFSNSNYNSYARENGRNSLNSQDITQRPLNSFDNLNRSFSPPVARARSPHSGYRHMRVCPPGRGSLSECPRLVDPAYVKPDVPLPTDESGGSLMSQNRGRGAHRLRGRMSQRGRGAHNTSGNRPQPRNKQQNDVEVVELNEDTLTCFSGISNCSMRKRKRQMKRRLMKKMHLNQNVNPEIVFLDSPSPIGSLETVAVHEENNIKIENSSNDKETCKTYSEIVENVQTFLSDVNNAQSVCATSVKSELRNDTTVKLEQSDSVSNLHSEVKMETLSNDISEISSTYLVKSETEIGVKLEADVKNEPIEVKLESTTESVHATITTPLEASDVKHEQSVDIPSEICILEKSNEISSKEGKLVNKEINTEPFSTTTLENLGSTRNKNIINNQELESKTEMEVEEPIELRDHGFESDDVSRDITLESDKLTKEDKVIGEISANEQSENEVSRSNVISWAQVKKHNIPIESLPENGDAENETDEEDEEESDDIRPLIKTKHCKTVGTVLSALQIFKPFNPEVPEDTPKLKISYDMYLPAEFRKAQRGLPQYRIAVFIESEPMPSAAQLHELQTRFTDNVPMLRAVVTHGSVVFYNCANVSLAVDVETPSNRS